MNMSLFQETLQKVPGAEGQKYIFITDIEGIASNIVLSGYVTVLIREAEGYFSSADSLVEWMNETAYSGDQRSEYIFVPCCSTKGQNDGIERYLDTEGLRYRHGWALFKKDYLTRPEAQEEVNGIIQNFIRSYEVPDMDLSRFHIIKNDKPSGVYDWEIYKYLNERENIFVLGAVPYIYEHGVFTPDLTGARVKTWIRELIYPELIKSSVIDRVYKLFLSEASLQARSEDLNNYPRHWINFRNGFYDPLDMKMIDHHPKYKAVNQIPHDYDIKAEPEGQKIEEWLSFITPDRENREMLLQYCGYCLTCDTRQQKFLILCGEGGSGKSTVIRMLEAVVGSENISNISLRELGSRFASFGLLGKLLNSCADLELQALEDTSTLKKVLGEDTLRAEAKGKDAISFRSYSKLIFSCNELPIIKTEKTNGFYRRLLILKMDRQPEEKRADFLELLQSELDYFIFLCVQAVERMYIHGSIDESHGSEEAVKTLRNDSDTVQAWLSEQCTLIDGNEKKDRTELYTVYENHCKDYGRTALTRQGFYRSMRIKGFKEEKSNGKRYFKGISTKKNCPKSAPEGAQDWEKVNEQMELPFD